MATSPAYRLGPRQAYAQAWMPGLVSCERTPKNNMKRTENVGSLSRNKKKEKETHPDHKGSGTIGGVEYWISGYINENTETKEKFFRLYFEPKKTDAAPVAAPALEESPDIPF